MNYYEELGVRQDASVDEIRQAYKLMTRLLHPDRHVEPTLKPAAERQMQRLGEIVAVLLDSAKRSHYDDLLRLGNRLRRTCGNPAIPLPAPPGEWDSGDRVAAFALRYWSWILLGILVTAWIAWNLLRPNAAALDTELHWAASQREAARGNGYGDRQPMQNANRSARRVTPGNARVSPDRPADRIPIVEEAWIFVPAPPEPPTSPPAIEDIPPGRDAAPVALEEVAKSPLESTPPLRRESSFAGRWLYSPQPGEVGEGGIYPATYVELLLVERGGELAGDYHARYKIPDRAVSPEVVFEVHGKAGSATSAQFAWVAGNHAKGVAEMTLRDPNVLCVTWWTSEFGRQATLGSGTAVLIRQQVP